MTDRDAKYLGAAFVIVLVLLAILLASIVGNILAHALNDIWPKP